MTSNKGLVPIVFRSTVIVLAVLIGLPSAIQAAGHKTSKAADALASALSTLDEAREYEKAKPGKAAALAVQAALDRYNALVAARVAEIERTLRHLDRQISRLTVEAPPPSEPGPASDDSKGGIRWLPQSLELRYLNLLNELRGYSRPSVALSPQSSFEIEPNNTPSEATPIDVSLQPVAIGSGLITPAGDQDYYSFQVPANSLVWAYVDTGGTQLGTSTDSFLTIFGPDGSTALESDDDDGTGNGCDATTESLAASAVAGLAVPVAGTYYARVTAASASDTIDPYQLFVCVVPASSVIPETESNDTPATANPIIPAGSVAGVRSGILSSPADVDVYSVSAGAGTPLYVSVDTDPERNGGSDVAVDLLTGDGMTLLFTADSSGSEPSGAEAFCFIAPSTAQYLVRVRQSTMMAPSGGNSPTYRVLVAEADLEGRCPPTILHAHLGSGSPDYPGTSGLQIGRLTRNGIVSRCGYRKACPGLFDTMGLRAYDAYTFTNSASVPACVSVTYSTEGCPFPGVFAAAYSGVFNPNNLCDNYLADSGFSIAGVFTWNFSFTLDPGESVVAVFTEVEPGSAAGCPYSVVVNGLNCSNAVPYDVCMQDDATGATFQAYVGDKQSTYYGRWEYRSGTDMLCGRAESVNYVPGRSLTMRDHDQADNAGCAQANMQAQFDFARHVALVQIAPLGGSTVTLRDRNLTNSTCGP